jgi:hypothetical protein
LIDRLPLHSCATAHRTSATSGSSAHAPSSFNRSKRVRLSEASEGRSSSRSASHVGSLPTPNESPPTAKTTGSWSSKGSQGPLSTSSHNYGYGPPSAPSASQASHYNVQQQLPPSRRSLSQASIPISALISPHAPSIGRSGTFHMRDPRKPSPIQSTPWSLAFPSQVQTGEARWGWSGWVERGGSPLHSWLFFIGFILFPLWWIAAFLPIPRTRRLGGTDAEKGVTLDDPQVEHGKRCQFLLEVLVDQTSLLFLRSRCEIVANTMSFHGCRVFGYLYSIYCSGRRLRMMNLRPPFSIFVSTLWPEDGPFRYIMSNTIQTSSSALNLPLRTCNPTSSSCLFIQ